MNCAMEARKLADYIADLKGDFQTYQVGKQISYYHIGALFADIILQAGVNYTTIVKPRVQRILLEYPEAYTVNRFKGLADSMGWPHILKWNHHVKLSRMERLINLSLENKIDTCADLKCFVLIKANCEKLLALNGIGPKTMDYLLKLLNIDTVAVDRHISSFVALANIQSKDYYSTKQIVEYAADFLGVSRSAIDYSIWRYMADKRTTPSVSACQLKLGYYDC